MRSNISPRAIRKIISAEGYLELELPRLALEELESIDDAGLHEAPRQFMMGRALKAMSRFQEAIRPFELAARQFPPPQRRLAWKELVECYRSCGSTKLADLADLLSKKHVREVQVELRGIELSIAVDQADGNASAD